jgi:hypothetical protein
METTLAVACGDGANEQNWVEGMKPDSPDDYTTCKKLLVFFYLHGSHRKSRGLIV